MRVVPEAMTAQAKKGYLAAATDVGRLPGQEGDAVPGAHEVVGHPCWYVSSAAATWTTFDAGRLQSRKRPVRG